MLILYELTILLFSTYIFSRTRNLYEINKPINYFFVYHLIFFGAGSLFGDLLWERNLSDFSKTLPLVLLFIYSALTVFLDKFLRIRKKTPYLISVSNNSIHYDSAQKIVFYSLLAIGLLSAIVYFKLTIGLSNILSDSLDDIRIEGRRGYGWLALLSIAFITVPTIAILSTVQINKSKIRFFCISTISFLFLLLIGNRGPSFEILVTAVTIYQLKKHGKISFKKVIFISTTLIVLLGALNLIRQGDSYSTELLLLKSVWRPYVNIDNFNLIIEHFSSHQPLLGDGYLMDLSVITPGYQENFGTWFKNAAGLYFSGGGVTVTYAGEIVANAGIYMLIPLAILYFIAIYIIDGLINKHKQTAIRYTHAFSISITAKSIVSSGIVSPILYTYIPMTMVLVFCLICSIALNNCKTIAFSGEA